MRKLSKRDLFRIGYKQGILRRLMKKFFGYKWYQFNRKQVRTFLKEVRYFPEELCDYLLEVSPHNLNDAKQAINDWLHFESKMTEFPRQKYVEGNGKNLFKLIQVQRNHYYLVNNLK